MNYLKHFHKGRKIFRDKYGQAPNTAYVHIDIWKKIISEIQDTITISTDSVFKNALIYGVDVRPIFYMGKNYIEFFSSELIHVHYFSNKIRCI